MRNQKGDEPQKYGERGEKVVFGPAIDAQGRVTSPTEEKGQAGSSSAQSGTRIVPQGGSGTAPPKTQK